MRTSLAIVALSALTAVSAQRKVFTAADINVATVSVNQRGKSIGRIVLSSVAIRLCRMITATEH